MMKVLIVSVVLSLFVVSGAVLAQQSAAPAAPAPAAPAAAMPATPAPVASLTISRMEMAGSIADREPANIADSFPATQDKVYCYLELKDIAKDQAITYAWTFGQDTDKVTQQIRKAARWRTWGSKTIAGRRGEWKVEIVDDSGAVLKSAIFKVE